MAITIANGLSIGHLSGVMSPMRKLECERVAVEMTAAVLFVRRPSDTLAGVGGEHGCCHRSSDLRGDRCMEETETFLSILMPVMEPECAMQSLARFATLLVQIPAVIIRDWLETCGIRSAR